MSKSFWHMTPKEKRELKEKNPREWERVMKEARDGTLSAIAETLDLIRISIEEMAVRR